MRLYLNSDVGERPEALRDGSEEELLRLLDWANIACGGHAGDDDSMAQVVGLCRKHGVQVGAHPGYPDREGFGREALDLSPEAISRLVFARAQGLVVHHVKPHGALYNQAAIDPAVACAIAEGVRRWKPEALLVGLAGSGMLRVWQDRGFAVAPEIFADRRYEPDGSLRPRRFPDALITVPAEAAEQVRRRADAATVCVHGDTPNAVAIAAAVRRSIAG
jgi:UPF0271 protein